MYNPELADKLRLDGNELFEKGDFTGAACAYTDGLKHDPNSMALYFNRSLAYMKVWKFDHAIKDAEKCLKIDPKFIRAYEMKANCHRFKVFGSMN